jgi:hypothetical protein
MVTKKWRSASTLKYWDIPALILAISNIHPPFAALYVVVGQFQEKAKARLDILSDKL